MENVTLEDVFGEYWKEELNMVRYDDCKDAENVKDELTYNSGWYNYSKLTFDFKGKRYSIEHKEHTSDNVCDFEWLLDTFTCLGEVEELQESITKEDLVNSEIHYKKMLKRKDAQIAEYKNALEKAHEKNRCLNHLNSYSKKDLEGLGTVLMKTYNEDKPTDKFFRDVANILLDLSKS